MKKITIFAAGATLVGCGLAACWYTGNSFDRLIAEQVAKAERDTGLTWQWVPNSANIFTRNGVIKLVVAPEDLALFANELSYLVPLDDELENKESFELHFTVNNTILPFYIKSHLLLDTHSGSVAPVFKELNLEQWQFGIESTSSLWSQSSSGRLWASEFKAKNDQNEFQFLPLSGDFKSDLDGTEGRVAITWQGMKLHEEQSKMELTLGEIKVSADLAEIGGILLAPQSELSLASMTMKAPDKSINVSLQQLSSQSQIKGDDTTLSNSYQMKIANLDIDNDTEKLAVTDGNLDLNVTGMDMEGYRELQEATKKDINDPAIQQALDKLLKRGATVELVDLSTKLNKEPVVLKGKVEMGATSAEQLFNSGEGMQALNGHISASFGDKLGQAVPRLAPLLDMMTSMGYLKPDQQKLVSELKLDKGNLTINDQPL